MIHYNTDDTIVALATPNGAGAIAVIRLSGDKAIEICNSCFKGSNLEKVASHTVHFGTIRTDENELIDEVLSSVFIAPRSYTKENTVEVSCHGSTYIIQRIIQLFIKKGARMARKGEFTLRAFLNGQLDLSQAEAVADLIASGSETQHELAMKQLRGGFSKEIQALRQELIDFAALIELELDFSEEDVEFADRTKLKALVFKIQKVIRQLLDSFQLGNAIKEGVPTVIAGRPNAGKSTLLNGLLNEERAIVSEIAGTTRDTIEEVLNIQGVPFRLVDTAGIRDATDKIEAIGVKKTFEKIKNAALLLYIFDVTALKPSEVQADLQQLQEPNLQIVAVANKMELRPDLKLDNYVSEALPIERLIAISALEKTNIDHLKNRIYQAALAQQLDENSTIVTNTRHFEALQKTTENLDAALFGMDEGVTGDFLAMDIRQALFHLGEITGEVTTDDLLASIFGRFCIGK